MVKGCHHTSPAASPSRIHPNLTFPHAFTPTLLRASSFCSPCSLLRRPKLRPARTFSNLLNQRQRQGEEPLRGSFTAASDPCACNTCAADVNYAETLSTLQVAQRAERFPHSNSHMCIAPPPPLSLPPTPPPLSPSASAASPASCSLKVSLLSWLALIPLIVRRRPQRCTPCLPLLTLAAAVLLPLTRWRRVAPLPSTLRCSPHVFRGAGARRHRVAGTPRHLPVLVLLPRHLPHGDRP